VYAIQAESRKTKEAQGYEQANTLAISWRQTRIMCTGVYLRANVRARTCVFAFGSEGFPQRVRAQTGPELKTIKWA
jgi:hypothetical protein